MNQITLNKLMMAAYNGGEINLSWNETNQLFSMLVSNISPNQLRIQKIVTAYEKNKTASLFISGMINSVAGQVKAEITTLNNPLRMIIHVNSIIANGFPIPVSMALSKIGQPREGIHISGRDIIFNRESLKVPIPNTSNQINIEDMSINSSSLILCITRM